MTVREEAWLIGSWQEMHAAGWGIETDRDQWVLTAPAEFVARFKLTRHYEVGRYGSLAEAYAAFRAVKTVDWISQLRREQEVGNAVEAELG